MATLLSGLPAPSCCGLVTCSDPESGGLSGSISKLTILILFSKWPKKYASHCLRIFFIFSGSTEQESVKISVVLTAHHIVWNWFQLNTKTKKNFFFTLMDIKNPPKKNISNYTYIYLLPRNILELLPASRMSCISSRSRATLSRPPSPVISPSRIKLFVRAMKKDFLRIKKIIKFSLYCRLFLWIMSQYLWSLTQGNFIYLCRHRRAGGPQVDPDPDHLRPWLLLGTLS